MGWWVFDLFDLLLLVVVRVDGIVMFCGDLGMLVGGDSYLCFSGVLVLVSWWV